jgi:hypothetical protein
MEERPMAIKKLTVKQKKAYIKAGGNKCPFCRSEDIESSHFEVDSGHSWQPIFCHECESEWNDIYKLADVEVTS